MRKIFLIALTSIFLLNSAFAGDANSLMKKRKKKKGGDKAFASGQNSVHGGMGFVPFLLKPTVAESLKVYGETETTTKSVIGFRYEIGVADFLSVGAQLGFSSSKINVVDVTNPDNVNGFNIKNTVIGARAVYHLSLDGPRLDPYAGILMGMCLNKVTAFGDRNYFDKPGSSSFVFAGFVGANFYIIEKLGIFAELGYKFALLNTGITFKF